MGAPYVAGDRDMPEWWTERDEAILRGEVAKLGQLPPVPAAAKALEQHDLDAGSDRVPWRLLVLLVVVLATGVLAAVAAGALARGGPAPVGPVVVVTPSTYGWPGPTGGPL